MKKVLLSLFAVMFVATSALAAVPNEIVGGGVNTAQYHSYDGLVCGDCHTIHNSEDGADVAVGGPFPEMLKRGNWTDMCLSCHMQGQNTSATAALPGTVADSGWTAPIVMTLDGIVPAGTSMPGGDFYYSNLDEKTGHNPAFTPSGTNGSFPNTNTSVFIAVDSTLGAVPPGGIIDGDDEWSCHTCHGMHSRFSGSYTAWRQVSRSVNGIVHTGDVTAFGVETATGNKTQDAAYEPILSNSRGDVQGFNYVNTRLDGNKLEAADLNLTESDTNKNVYRGGFSSFCSVCHGDFHGGDGESRTLDNGNTRVAGNWVRHPSNVAMNEAGSKYGIATYTKQVTNSQGTAPNPVGYDWRYPLVQPNADFTVEADVASMGNAATAIGNDRIMCLTCHKAHATEFANMTRWDSTGHSFIADGEVGFDGVASNGDNIAYGCAKCHQKGGSVAFVKQF